MHDFHLADIIYKTIIDYAQKNNLKRITKAVIELGAIVEHGEEILAENLEFNIKMMAEGGPAENISLKIIKTIGPNWTLKEIEGE
jgi:Zn finger protein HypA/HybF involved in hydrogenase expression